MPLAYLINYTGLAAILVCGVCLFAAAQGEASQAVRSSASSAVNSSVPDLALAVHERRGLPEQEFANTLSECESYRYDPRVPAKTALRLVQALFDYAVRLKLVQTPQGEKTAWKQS